MSEFPIIYINKKSVTKHVLIGNCGINELISIKIKIAYAPILINCVSIGYESCIHCKQAMHFNSKRKEKSAPKSK